MKYILLLMLFVSCGARPIEECEGGIVVSKSNEANDYGNYYIKVKIDQSIKEVLIHPFDYKAYSVGDTIRGY